MTISEQRAAVVAEALTWKGTPYHHAARLKGIGVDCGQMTAAVYESVGVVDRVVFPATYSPDWNLHRGEELYLDRVLELAHEIDGPPQPGDLAVWRFGRAWNHGAIVIEWPLIIHARAGVGVVLEDSAAHAALAEHPCRFFSPWGE